MDRKMKAIVNTAPGKLEWLDVPMPEPAIGQVRIRIGACGICATDLEMISGWTRTGYPSIPGHEWSGTVDALGQGVEPSLLHQRCVAENVLGDGGEVGFEHPGGYGQYLLTEARHVHVLPDPMPFATAAMIEPLAVSVRAMSRLGSLPRAVLVFGDGPIGLLITALLSRAGVREVVLVGGHASRLLAGMSLGATLTLNYHDFKDTIAASIREATKTDFRAVIEASGNPQALTAGLELVSREGSCLMIGDYGLSRADFLWNTILLREITLLGTNASGGAWPRAVEFAIQGEIPLDRLISHHVPAADFAVGVELSRHHKDETLKVVLDWA
ncbi:MAG TPA: zinc-binding dehydrogenase [Anaerolineae bacterium]